MNDCTLFLFAVPYRPPLYATCKATTMPFIFVEIAIQPVSVTGDYFKVTALLHYNTNVTKQYVLLQATGVEGVSNSRNIITPKTS